jgi:protein phosphatase
VEVLLRAYQEERDSLPSGERLYRAVQQANIEIHDRAMIVPDLRGMATTLTAAVVDQGNLTAVHVGDSRLYLIRGHAIVQLTKDHTVAAEKVRLGFLSKEKAKTHPDRSVLTRSVGRELIVSRDRIHKRLRQGDVILACSDGLHGVLDDDEIRKVASGHDPTAACRALIDLANARGTPDNLTVAMVRIVGPVPEPVVKGGIRARLRRIFR